MTTTTTTRPTEDVCPSWCSGHEGLYQDWEKCTSDGALVRNHADAGVLIGSAIVCLTQEDHRSTGMAPARVGVSIDDMRGELELTEAQAHELGMSLVRAADVLRREATRRAPRPAPCPSRMPRTTTRSPRTRPCGGISASVLSTTPRTATAPRVATPTSVGAHRGAGSLNRTSMTTRSPGTGL